MSASGINPTTYSELDKKLPIVMLPVRVETRYFAASGTDLELRVRIFPSGAHVTSDRPNPDTVERDEIVAYWTVRKAQGDQAAATTSAWQRVTDLFGDARAQWLRRLLTPAVNADGTLAFPNVPTVAPEDPTASLVSEATGLPTRFFVSGFAAGARQFIVAGSKVPASVAAGPQADASAGKWQTDFAAAEAIGLGIRIRLPRTAATQLTRLLVYGVREGPEAATSRPALEGLLERHVRGDGASLMQAGTPTNNTADAPVPARPAAPESAPKPLSDGFRTAQALGVDGAIFSGIGGSENTRESLVRAMHIALRPATLEYFMMHVMAPVFDSNALTRIGGLFDVSVRPSGPLPALVLGSQPYGVLPVTSMANWKTAAGTVDGFMQGLEILSRDWMAAAAKVPRLGSSADIGSDLIAVLSQSPTSKRWVARPLESQIIAGRNINGGDPAKYQIAINLAEQRKLQQELTPLGLTGRPLALDFVFRANTFDLTTPLAAPEGSDPNAPLAANYISAMATASADQLNKDAITGATPHTLLYMLLRHSTLQLLAGVADKVLGKPPLAEQVLVAGGAETAWTRINTKVASLGNKSVSDISAGTLPGSTDPNTILALNALRMHRLALQTLAAAPVHELDRLTSDAIDAVSFRLDAWITAQATARLSAMRNQAATGAHLGAYAWLDAPAVPTAAATDGGNPVNDADSEGFIHAPGLDQARTGAILRSAYLGRENSGAEAAYAVDLSSTRIRLARHIIAEIQGGANLSIVLSARIERTMIESGLGPQLPALRQQFPLDSGDGRARIDGVALAQAWSTAAPPANLKPVADLLKSTLDAIGDLLLAEGVHQQAIGNPSRASVALAGLEKGTALPDDFGVIRTTQADAVSRTWRLVTPLAGDALNAWVEGVIGDVSKLTAFIAADGSVPRKATVASLDITARQLLDFVQDSADAVPLANKFAQANDGGKVTFSPELNAALAAAYAISRLLRNARGLSVDNLGNSRTPLVEFDAASTRRQWLHDLGRVREPIEALGILDAVTSQRGGDLGLRFATAGPHLNLVTIGDWPAAGGGTLLDSWNEITPGVECATGIAMHYDAPRSRPPQAVLVAVPADMNAGWNIFGVETILNETADLARMRMVRPADVHGSFLPALYFADNLQGDTVSTDFFKVAYVVEAI